MIFLNDKSDLFSYLNTTFKILELGNQNLDCHVCNFSTFCYIYFILLHFVLVKNWLYQKKKGSGFQLKVGKKLYQDKSQNLW